MSLVDKIRSLVVRNPHKPETNVNVEVPDQMFVACPECKAMLYRRKLLKNHNVCYQCDHHMPLACEDWVELLSDRKEWQPLFTKLRPRDALGFPEYSDKLRKNQKNLGNESIWTGRTRIDGHPCLLGVMDPRFFMASLGSVAGEKVTRLFELGLEQRLPVVLVIRSGGARMQEGVLSLMQMAKTSAAIKRFSDAGLLYVAVLCHPTTGGVSASFAMLGDLILAEPHALIGFAGPRVIEQTIRQKLPEGFQTSEYLLDKGFVDAVVPRAEMRGTLSRVLQLHRREGESLIDTATPVSLWKRWWTWLNK